jgi:hypothetical protein
MIYWTKSSVKDNIKQLLVSYIPLMQVKGVKNYHELSGNLTLSEKNFIDLITLDLFPDKNLEKTAISFIYTGQDLSFDINPSNNELLGPFKDASEGASMAPPKNTFTYQFFYDVSYPVVVEITDEYAPGQYYTFVFALESTIKENLPLKEWWNETKRPLFVENGFFDVIYNDPLKDKKIVDPRTGINYSYKERVKEIAFCNAEQRLSGDVYIKTYDASTKQPLENVDVTFGCGNYASCPMGRTEYDQILDVNAFNGKLPLCMNGYVQLEKSGYEKKVFKLSTTSSTINLGSIYLEPIKTVNVTVKIYPMTRKIITGHSIGLIFPNSSISPSVNDTILINIDRIPSGLEEPVSQTVFISPTTKNTQINLIPGRYTISGQLFSAEGYTIYAGCDEVCDEYFAGICVSYKDIPENDIPIRNAIVGGIDIDKVYPLNVKREYLTNNKSLEIYLIQMPPPPCINDMQEMGKTTDIVNRYRSKVMPVFK